MTLNAQIVSAGEAARVLRAGWAAQVDGRLTASWMLHGRPGVGKTEIVAALADEMGARLFDLRLTTIEPQDLRGLPYYDHEKGRTVWYRPEDLPDDPATPSVLFLDELTAAAPHLQPTVYGLLQERRVGRHRLPDTVLIVAAGNSVEDGAVAYEMGTALSDRLIHLHVVANADDWVENYAIPQGLDPAVIAFIRARPDLLETTEDTLRRGQTIACTPRSWSRVSEIRRAVADRDVWRAMVAGTVGEAAAAEFAVVADDVSASVRIDDMMEARGDAVWPLYPDTLHGLTALISALVAIASEETIDCVIEIMGGLGRLAVRREEASFTALPLAELQSFGFEMLIRKGLDLGLEEAFGRSETYRAYADQRAAQGLD